MEHIDDLADATDALDRAVGAMLAGEVRRLSDADLIDVTVLLGAMLRRVEGALVEVVDVLGERSAGPNDDRLDVKHGCRNVTELAEKLTSASSLSITRWKKAASVTQPRFTLTGTPLPPIFPTVREKMHAGHLGLDGVLALTKPLLPLVDRVSRDELWAADAALGVIVDAGPAAFEHAVAGRFHTLPTAADDLGATAMRTAYLLDQDGAEPTEDAACINRSLTVGRLTAGLVPVRGDLLPEVASVLLNIIDAVGNPHGKPAGVRFTVDGHRPVDDSGDPDARFIEREADRRTAPQRAHDALAIALNVASASRDLPTLGGAAPTLVVTVSAEDVRTGAGWAETRGLPVPLNVAAHVSCGATIQRVLLNDGKVVQMATEERIFNAWQRRAIATRDQGCVIPGCHVPATWCEVHHITPWAQRQRTDVSDGCLLCWYHHRYLERFGWRIRSRDGVIEVQAPRWLDARGRWRATGRRAEPANPAAYASHGSTA